MAHWSPGKFTSQEWRGILFGADIDLYVGDAASAYEHVKGLSHNLKESSFLFVQYVRALTAFVQGRAAIATLDGLPAALRRARLAEIRRLQRRLDREQMAWTTALAAILRAGSALAARDRSGAAAALRLAIERAQASEMALYAASAKHQLGLLLGGSEGAKLVGEAEDAMAARGIRAPARFAAMLVPGRWAPPEN
jgi:hypothetical protein